MSITEIVNNLYITEDKELFFKAFNIWCNILYGKYRISDELLEVFIKDITETDIIYICEQNTVIVESNDFKSVVINYANRTTSFFDSKLNVFINEYQ